MDSFKCITGGCIPNEFVCDGHPHCPDFSDEWECFNLTSEHEMDEDKVEDETEMKNVLKVKRSDGQYAYVCADKWSDKYSDLVCNELGYSKAIGWSKVKRSSAEENARYLEINGDNVNNQQIISSLNETEKCGDDEILAIDCQLYSKFSDKKIIFLENQKHENVLKFFINFVFSQIVVIKLLQILE